MGWGNCGVDSEGRPIGYMHDAICDHPDCNEKIDRGLAFACGGMHGDCGGHACEGYFCSSHLKVVIEVEDFTDQLGSHQLCPACFESLKNRIGEMVVSGDYAISFSPTTQEESA